MNRRLNIITIVFAALLFFFESSVPTRGQDAGLYRAGQGRRIGRVTLPTPPFNPDAGILGDRKGRAHGPSKNARRRTARRGVRTARRKKATKVLPRRVNNPG